MLSFSSQQNGQSQFSQYVDSHATFKVLISLLRPLLTKNKTKAIKTASYLLFPMHWAYIGHDCMRNFRMIAPSTYSVQRFDFKLLLVQNRDFIIDQICTRPSNTSIITFANSTAEKQSTLRHDLQKSNPNFLCSIVMAVGLLFKKH
jgi:hypothetical protein